MKGGLDTLVLRLTNRCNLACGYCYAGSGPAGEDLSPERAAEAVALACPPGGALRIQFTGGEPLLRWDTAVKVLDFGRASGRRFHAAIQTNGTLLTPALCRELRARRVAVVPQRGPCPEDLTAREMVLLGRYAHLSPWGWYGPGDHRAADCALAATDTTGLAHRRLHELSGGELQRVLLARALAQESPLLLLDELAAGLDLARMTGLFDLLERRRAAGACVLMAVHDCNLAALYATRLLGLREGRLAFDGPVRQVFTEENLSALYQTPVTVLPHPLWGLPQALSARARGPWAAPHAAAPAAAASVDTAPAGSAADAPALRSHRPGPGGGRDPHATNVPGNNTRFAKN